MVSYDKLRSLIEKLESFVVQHFKGEDIQMFYGDWRRRLELLKVVLQLIPMGSTILDAGAAPGFTSLALRFLGYDICCVDINPETYGPLLEKQGIKVFRVDLEHENAPLSDERVDCVVFTEVLEHLNYYNLPHTFSEINRVLKIGGVLFLTTPNIASIGKRLKLLLGKQPLGSKHVREYTMKEVVQLLEENGFSVVDRWFSYAYNLTPHDANSEEYKDNLIKVTFKRLTIGNVFHCISLPVVFAIPKLRATIVIIARKEHCIKPQIPYRRF